MRCMKPHCDNQNTANIYIKVRNMTNLHKLLKPPKASQMIPGQFPTNFLNKVEIATCKLTYAPEVNKAIIVGCTTQQGMNKCETYMNTLGNNPGY